MMQNNILNDIKFIPFIDFYKKQRIKSIFNQENDSGEFSIEQLQSPYNNPNIIMELDRQTTDNLFYKVQRFTYPIKDHNVPYSEIYEGSISGQFNTQNIEQAFEETKFSRLQIIADENSIRTMISKISKEQYENNNYILKFIINIFGISNLSYSNTLTLLQLPQLWEQYIVQKSQSQLTDQQIQNVIDEYDDVVQGQDSIIDYQTQNLVSDSQASLIKLSYYLTLFNSTLDEFEKKFNPMLYDVKYQISHGIFNSTLSYLLDSNQDIIKQLDATIWVKLLLRGLVQYDSYDELNHYIVRQNTDYYKNSLYLIYFDQYGILSYLNSIEVQPLDPFPDKATFLSDITKVYDIFEQLFVNTSRFVLSKYNDGEQANQDEILYKTLLQSMFTTSQFYNVNLIYEIGSIFPIQFSKDSLYMFEMNDYETVFDNISITDDGTLEALLGGITIDSSDPLEVKYYKSRILMSMSNNNIFLKFDDILNDDSETNTQFKEQNDYILNSAQQLRWNQIYNLTNYSYDTQISQEEKNTNYLSYFIPFNFTTLYKKDIDKDTMKIIQTKDTQTNTIQQIKLDTLKFNIRYGSSVYTIEY